MRRILSKFALIVLAVASMTACQSLVQSPETRLLIEPIQIESVEVVPGTVPSGFGVHVKGTVGDGCSELLPVRQLRQGTDIVFKIERQRPEGAICTQLARLFDQVIPLEGAFLPGQYAVRVNTTSVTFSVP